MSSDRDLFEEEQQMVSMSFGDHIEELRARLILALLGLFVGVIFTFLPPLNLGQLVVWKMQEPAERALTAYQHRRAAERAQEAVAQHLFADPVMIRFPADELFQQFRQFAPHIEWPEPETLRDHYFELPQEMAQSDLITSVASVIEPRHATISLSPMEPAIIFFLVCMVTGLVIASPWVFYQIWAFIAAGLYRHERRYVKKFLPFSIGLFLSGVLLCFFAILPLTLRVLLEFNVWLGIEPSLRISEWMTFATFLPLVFGIAFQTPLVMLFLERIGIFTVDDYRQKRKFAILIMVIIAAILTPDPTIVSQLMLALPMIALYELGIIMVRRKKESPVTVGV